MPLGTWIHRVFTDEQDWRVERVGLPRSSGSTRRTEQRWTGYAVSVVAFAVVSVVAPVPADRRCRDWLPWSLGRSMDWHTAVNTAVSFVTNTNWQSYAGEAGAGYTVQAVGLTVQNFVSAATGPGRRDRADPRPRAARHRPDRQLLGRPGARHVRILLPMAAVAAVVLLVGGVIQNLTDPQTITTVTGGQQVVQGGPVASQEAIKELGTNGGGFFNANSAHPFENPNAWTNLFEIFLLLVIPFSLPYAYGLMVGNRRQGVVATATMAGLLVTSMGLAAWAEYSAVGGRPLGSMEGKEQRFGIAWSSIFAGATTGTSTGAVNSMHDSFSALGGAVPLSNMMLGEVSPGGVGTGLYNLLVYVVLAVFIAGLMVGRTPELLGKTVGRKEITYVALSVVVTPALVLIGTGLAIVLPAATAGLLNSGPHGLSEMMYAYTSASNNNGSAFAGLTADQPFLNLTLAFCMFFGRLIPIVLVLALAGVLRRPAQAPRHRRHHADRHPPVHRPARRHRRGGRRADLLPGPGTRADRGGPVMTVTPLIRTGWDALPQAFAKLDPRHTFRSPVIFVVWVGSVLTTVLAVQGPLGVHDLGHAVAVGDRAVRQPRRGRRRGPRQGPGRDAAQDPHRDHRPPAARGRHRGAGARHRAARSATSSSSRPARSSRATATSSRGSPPSTSRRSPASPRPSSASPAATGAPSPAARPCCRTGSSSR